MNNNQAIAFFQPFIARFFDQPINQTIKRIYLSALIVRLVLIAYSLYHDSHFAVRFTDVDYIVFSDAADHIKVGESPFARATYRYTPFLAWGVYLIDCLFDPLIGQWRIGGKLVFSLLDLLLAWLIDQCVMLDYQFTNQSTNPSNNHQINRSRIISLLFSLFNPLSLTVSTRGNADVIVTAASAGVIYGLLRSNKQTNKQSINQANNDHWCRLAAILWGFAVHFKLYPIIYGPAILMFLLKRQSDNQSIRWYRLIEFFLLSFITFVILTGVAYHLDGDKFLDSAILYHFVRADTRHNFSIYFLWLYMSNQTINQTINTSAEPTIIQSLNHLVAKLAFLPQLISIVFASISLSVGRSTTQSTSPIDAPSVRTSDQTIKQSTSQSINQTNKQSALPLAFVVCTWLFVTFNKVCTAQYFLWYLGLLPIIFHRIDCSINQSIKLLIAWICCEFHWLFWAYLIEMRGLSVFEGLHFASCLFFVVNIACVAFIIKRSW